MKQMFLLHGPNEVLRRRKVEEILEKFTHEKKNTLHLYVNETDPISFKQHALANSLFSEGDVYIIKNWDMLKDSTREEWEETLLEILSSQTPHTFILSTPSITQKFLSSLEKIADIEECKPLYGKDIKQFMKQLFEKYRLAVDPPVYDYLLDISHESLEEIDRMISLLIEAASKTGTITLELCKNLLIPTVSHSIFDLIRGIFTTNPSLAVAAFRNLRLEGESLQKIFAMVFRTNKLLWSFKTKGNISLETWAQKVSISLFEAKKIQEYDQIISQKKLSKWFERIAYLEELSKTAREEIAEVMFEAFLLEG